MEKKFDRDFLLACASEFVTWIGLQDPMYVERIEILKSERGLDNLQALASLVAGCLDRGDHMYYCEREFMTAGYSGHLGPRPCVVCDVEFSPSQAQDEMCGAKACSEAYFAALDSKFTKKAK